MRLVTWNVNSIRARGERVDELLRRSRPTSYLQETKVDAAHFPHRADRAPQGSKPSDHAPA